VDLNPPFITDAELRAELATIGEGTVFLAMGRVIP